MINKLEIPHFRTRLSRLPGMSSIKICIFVHNIHTNNCLNWVRVIFRILYRNIHFFFSSLISLRVSSIFRLKSNRSLLLFIFICSIQNSKPIAHRSSKWTRPTVDGDPCPTIRVLVSEHFRQKFSESSVDISFVDVSCDVKGQR